VAAAHPSYPLRGHMRAKFTTRPSSYGVPVSRFNTKKKRETDMSQPSFPRRHPFSLKKFILYFLNFLPTKVD
jgi:hypothetical protein